MQKINYHTNAMQQAPHIFWLYVACMIQIGLLCTFLYMLASCIFVLHAYATLAYISISTEGPPPRRGGTTTDTTRGESPICLENSVIISAID